MFVPQARPLAQNTAPCLKPWAVSDRWLENQTPDWDIDDSFDRYVTQGGAAGQLLPNPDVYVAPSETGPGTGFHLPTDYGRRLRVKVGEPSLSPGGGWFFAIDVNGAGGSGNAYRTAIATCGATTVSIGDFLTPLSGNLHGPTVQGVADLIQLDPAAFWDVTANGGQGAIVGSAFAVSPRVVAIPMFDPDLFQSTAASGSPQVRVANIFGVFIEGVESRTVIGRIVSVPGTLGS
jgi:hypothetical protein